MTTRPAAPLHYRVIPTDLHAHLYRVELRIPAPLAMQALSLPVWIPGSYLVREFAKNLQGLKAHQNGQSLAVTQINKRQWEVQCQAGQPLCVEYEVCAYDTSVRTAWLDSQRGFFNGTSVCLQALGQAHLACELEIVAPEKGATPVDWQCATSLMPLKVNRRGFGRYRADSYDELVDSPVEMGAFWSGSFTACGVPHRFVVAGASPSFDGERLLADTQKICETAIRFWHGRGKAPHDRYVFMLNATHDGYGGLEHAHSTALICARRDLPRQDQAQPGDGYTTLLGLICHEYFHTWNVKRLRPAEFARYDYQQENYTALLWFFEGFTSYYDDLLLRRAGLIDNATYLKLIGKTLQQVLQTPGRAVQSVAQSSFDAWTKYYRQDENTLNATVSYYTKGSLVALCLDLALRSEGKTTLDAVMRGLWKRCKAGPMTEADLHAVLLQLSGRDWTPEMQAWVHGTDDLPVTDMLHAHGVQVQHEAATAAQQWGVRVQESGAAIQVKMVLRGSPAEHLGLMAGDEWWAVEVAGQGWRIQRLDELPTLLAPGISAVALVARDRRIVRMPMPASLPKQAYPALLPSLQIDQLEPLDRWLSGKP